MRLRQGEPLVALHDALEALGDDGHLATYGDEVAVSAIIGSAARSQDFDRDFRPRRRSSRLQQVRRMFEEGRYPPPLDLVRLGEVYFVLDGHHRIAVARERGWQSIPARVKHVCTVAYARACLSAAHLDTLAAQRRFLEEVPLPEEVRTTVWLDRPADWSRLTDAALAWAWRRQTSGGEALVTPFDLASAWWYEFVQPLIGQLREAGTDHAVDLGDLQLVVTALAQRDGLARMDLRRPGGQEAACDSPSPARPA